MSGETRVRPGVRAVAGGDGESGAAAQRPAPGARTESTRASGGCVGAQPARRTPASASARALDLDLDAGRRVADRAGQAQLAGQGVDERAEPDALDDPARRRSRVARRGGWARADRQPSRRSVAHGAPPGPCPSLGTQADAKPDAGPRYTQIGCSAQIDGRAARRRSLALSDRGGPAMGRFHRHDDGTVHDASRTTARALARPRRPLRLRHRHRAHRRPGADLRRERPHRRRQPRATSNAAGALAVNVMSLARRRARRRCCARRCRRLGGRLRIGVIEGDIETSLDADRLAGLGAAVELVNTGNGFGGECHLDAPMVRSALVRLPLDVARPGRSSRTSATWSARPSSTSASTRG